MQKILITGAGGFIGGRLVEVLKETLNPEINILLRRVEKGARISRYPLHFYTGSIDDDRSLGIAMEGCDAVVHCAHDFSNPEANLKAARLIANNCLEKNVSRLVYISSFAVHRSDNDEVIHENTPLNDKWEYAINKKAVEEIFVDFYRKHALPVIILRPTIVYGPFSTAWTISTVKQMIGGRLVIPYEGKGICNSVYIDDVVQAIIKALDVPRTLHGRAYIVSGNDDVNWKEFYTAHLSYKFTNPPVYMSHKESEQRQNRRLGDHELVQKSSALKDPITFLKRTPVYKLYQNLLKKPSLKKKLLSAKASIPRPLVYFDKDTFEIHSCKGKADISKIREEMGFKPLFSFAEGMDKTRLWIEWANLNLEA